MSIDSTGVTLVSTGGMHIESIPFQDIVSWKLVGHTKFRLMVQREEGKKKKKDRKNEASYDFGTSQGPEICETMDYYCY